MEYIKEVKKMIVLNDIRRPFEHRVTGLAILFPLVSKKGIVNLVRERNAIHKRRNTEKLYIVYDPLTFIGVKGFYGSMQAFGFAENNNLGCINKTNPKAKDILIKLRSGRYRKNANNKRNDTRQNLDVKAKKAGR